MEPSDSELFQDFLAGDLQAFTVLVDRYERALFQYFYRHTGNLHDSENLVQETLTRVFLYARSYDPTMSLRTWIFTVACNRYRDFLKECHRQERRRAAAEEAHTSGQTSRVADPADEVLGQALRKEVRTALAELPDRHRSVLLLKHFHGFRYSEIARAQACSVGTVKSRMHHAVVKLRDKLVARGLIRDEELQRDDEDDDPENDD